MNARYAIVADGRVVNVVDADAGWQPNHGAAVEVDAGSRVGPGWLYDGQAFSPPHPPAALVPEEVTMRQARLALHRAGVLGNVVAAINQMPEQARTEAQIEWEYSSTLRRAHPLVTDLGSALGLTPQQLDALFIEAAAL